MTEHKRTFYEEIEQDEDVPRGYVKVIQLITYEIDGKKKNEFNEFVDNKVGRGSYFCQKAEDKDKFVKRNRKYIIESFNVQLKKQTAIDYLDTEENMDAFGVK